MNAALPILNPSDRILILTSSSTGNNVFCTPALRLLRKHLPHSVIDVVALNKLSAEVFEGNPDINAVHIAGKPRTFDKLAAGYDKVLAFNVNALKKLAGMATQPITVTPAPGLHMAEQLLSFAAGLLGCEISDADRRYIIGEGKGAPSRILDKVDVGDDDVLVNIHLGCGRTLLHGWKIFYRQRAVDKKMWPIEAYIELGQALVRADPRIRITVTGTRNEAYLARQFVRDVPGSVSLAGQTSVADLYRLMQRLNLFISHDCGVMHIAAATEVPMVGLFGPTNPAATGPYPLRPQHVIIQKLSMAKIGTSDVVSAALRLLSAFPRNK